MHLGVGGAEEGRGKGQRTFAPVTRFASIHSRVTFSFCDVIVVLAYCCGAALAALNLRDKCRSVIVHTRQILLLPGHGRLQWCLHYHCCFQEGSQVEEFAHYYRCTFYATLSKSCNRILCRTYILAYNGYQDSNFQINETLTRLI